jgi:hypothetical protein
MSANKNIPVFEKRIFWDVNFETLDYDNKASFLIERVFEPGDVQDILNCRRYYGDEQFKQVLMESKWLSLETIYLSAAIFNNKLTDYRCYNTQQLSQTPFAY